MAESTASQSEPNERDQKLLDRALEEFAESRRTFYRDLKIIGALLVTFQFGIFFRFVTLNDQRRNLLTKLEAVRKEQLDVEAIHAPLSGLSEQLSQGSAAMTAELAQGREALRKEIITMFDELDRLSARRGDGPAETAARARAQSDLAAQLGLPPLLSGLADDDLAVLREGRQSEKLDRVLERVVADRIIGPAFQALNQKKETVLAAPFDAGCRTLATALSSREAAMHECGVDASAMKKSIADAERELEAVQFAPPKTDGWWRSYETKGEVFKELQSQTQRAAEAIHSRLSDPERSLKAIGADLAKQAQEIGTARSQLDRQLKGITTDFESIKGQLQEIAKPLSAIALPIERVVLIDPLLVAVVAAYFVWRFTALRQRSGTLASTCRDMGFSDTMVQTYFGTAPAGETMRSSRFGAPTLAGVLLVLALACPGVLTAVSIGSVLHSPSLREEAPKLLYAVALAVLIVAYLYLAHHLLRGHWRRSSLPVRL